jgi:hypothetical protein
MRRGNPMREPPEPRWCEEHGSLECRRRTKRGSDVCHGLAIIGTATCRMHAGEPGEAAKMRGRMVIEERAMFARILRVIPRRPYEQILSDTVHVFDVKARELLAELETDGNVTPEQYLQLIDRWQRAGRWALRALDADVRERMVRLEEEQSQLVVDGSAGCSPNSLCRPSNSDVATSCGPSLCVDSPATRPRSRRHERAQRCPPRSHHAADLRRYRCQRSGKPPR